MPKKRQLLFTAATIILLILGFSWNSLVAKAVNSAQSQLLAKINENINGRLQAERIDFSFFGTLTAHQVTVYDHQNIAIGRIGQVSVRFALYDLLSGNADLHSLQSVTLENSVILLAQKNGNLNWDSLLKTGARQPRDFRGEIQIKQGTLTSNLLNSRTIESIDGTIDFAKYPTLAFAFTGKTGTTKFRARGAWDFNGPGTLQLTTAKAAVSDLPLDLVLPKDTRITGGFLTSPVLTLIKQEGKCSFTGGGVMENITANISGYGLSSGTGNIRLNDEKVELQDATALVDGQPIALNGDVALAASGANLALNASSASFDPAAVGASSLKGPFAFQAKITGLIANPQAKGHFSIPHGSLGPIAFANATGNFSYIAGILTIIDARAQALSGALAVNGDVIPTTEQYNLSASGSDLDSALLTAKDIRGKLDFDAILSGKGTAAGHAAGNFRMGGGSFSGIPFLSMTGAFVKQGSQMNLYNIIASTIGGTFQAEGLSVDAIIKLKEIDSSGTAHEIFNEAAFNNVISEKLKNLLSE